MIKRRKVSIITSSAIMHIKKFDRHSRSLSGEIACGWPRCYRNRYCIRLRFFFFILLSLSFVHLCHSLFPLSRHKKRIDFHLGRLPWDGLYGTVIRSIKLIDSSNINFAASGGTVISFSSNFFRSCVKT